MADKFSRLTAGLESPAENLTSVTPDDTSDLPMVCRALNVGTSGFVQITTVSGAVGRIYVTAGVAFPVRASRVWSTGTTAMEIVALW